MKETIDAETIIPGKTYSVPRDDFWGIVADISPESVWVDDYHIISPQLVNIFINNPAIGEVVQFRLGSLCAVTIIDVSLSKLFELTDPETHPEDHASLKRIVHKPGSD